MVCGYEENVILTVENRTSEGLQEEHFVEVPLTGPGNGSRHVPINVEDYIFRGGELEDYSIYELAMVTSYFENARPRSGFAPKQVGSWALGEGISECGRKW
jgi:hypothetical protein